MLSRRGSRSSEHVPEAPQPATAESGRKFRILVVDDSAASRKLTMWMLGQLGYVADAAGNGCEALEAIERGSFDLILMDCRIPEMDGYEATRQIRQREGPSSHIKVVAMTAHLGDEHKCRDADMDDHIDKPFKLEELAAVLNRILGKKNQSFCGSVGPGCTRRRERA
jgi:two-component system, sensor histidine kinase and response regulator